MNKAMLRMSVAKFAGEVDRLRDEAAHLRDSGWDPWVPAHRGELYGVVAEALNGEIVRATRLGGEKGDVRNNSSSGLVGPPPDADGHTIFAGRYSGFGSRYTVQALIREGTSKEDAVAILRKMADRLEDDWARLTYAERYEPERGPAEEFGPPPEIFQMARNITFMEPLGDEPRRGSSMLRLLARWLPRRRPRY